MIFVIEKINNDLIILLNVFFGYNIWDYCGNVLKVMWIINDFFWKLFMCNEIGERSKLVVVFIGLEEFSIVLVIVGFF